MIDLGLFKQIYLTDITPAEKRVLRLLALGYSTEEAAEELFLSPRTISTHLSSIRSKTYIKSRSQLIAAMHLCNLVQKKTI